MQWRRLASAHTGYWSDPEVLALVAKAMSGGVSTGQLQSCLRPPSDEPVIGLRSSRLGSASRWLAHGLAGLILFFGLAVVVIANEEHIGSWSLDAALDPLLVESGAEVTASVAYTSNIYVGARVKSRMHSFEVKWRPGGTAPD